MLAVVSVTTGADAAPLTTSRIGGSAHPCVGCAPAKRVEHTSFASLYRSTHHGVGG